MSYADDIRLIANQGKNKGALDGALTKDAIDGDSKGLVQNEQSPTAGMAPPLTLEILTYDDTKDVTFEDINAVQYTLKTAATARVTDANGNVYDIDTITYA